MEILYKSTRSAEQTVTASEAILKGLADGGGLYVPVSIPKLDAGWYGYLTLQKSGARKE